MGTAQEDQRHMATESIKVTSVIPASPDRIYAAWLDSVGHGAMTGGPAEIDGRVGGQHKGWGGYIWGETLELDPDKRIVQSWRTTEFPAEATDSRVVVHLEPEGEHTRVTIEHTDIPEGQGQKYERGWQEHYFV